MINFQLKDDGAIAGGIRAERRISPIYLELLWTHVQLSKQFDTSALREQRLRSVSLPGKCGHRVRSCP
jgi:hypothetical protein